FQIQVFQVMLSSSLNLDHSVVPHMESRSNRKWKTLRNISSSQEESEIAVFEPSVPEIDGVESDAVENDGEGERPVEEMLEEGSGIAEGLIDVPQSEVVPQRALVVLPVASTTRLIRETLENFTDAEVVTTSNPLRGFELALQRPYRVFLFGMQIGELSGPTLYELISRAYANEHGPKRLPPGVVFVREEDDPRLPEELAQDVRVKDVISKQVRIDRLLKAIGNAIEVRDPTAK
ncbi:MAG: hypothetical protein AAF491_06830, partial [Verrucomicrobiota bacterium]